MATYTCKQCGRSYQTNWYYAGKNICQNCLYHKPYKVPRPGILSKLKNWAGRTWSFLLNEAFRDQAKSWLETLSKHWQRLMQDSRFISLLNHLKSLVQTLSNYWARLINDPLFVSAMNKPKSLWETISQSLSMIGLETRIDWAINHDEMSKEDLLVKYGLTEDALVRYCDSLWRLGYIGSDQYTRATGREPPKGGQTKSMAVCKACGKSYDHSFMGWPTADLCKECFDKGRVVVHGNSGQANPKRSDVSEGGPTSTAKKCPYCAEMFNVEAVICCYCNMDLRTGGLVGVSTNKSSGYLWIFIIVGGIVVAVLIVLFFSGFQRTQYTKQPGRSIYEEEKERDRARGRIIVEDCMERCKRKHFLYGRVGDSICIDICRKELGVD